MYRDSLALGDACQQTIDIGVLAGMQPGILRLFSIKGQPLFRRLRVDLTPLARQESLDPYRIGEAGLVLNRVHQLTGLIPQF